MKKQDYDARKHLKALGIKMGLKIVKLTQELQELQRRNTHLQIDLQGKNPCEGCDGNWCLAEYGEQCSGME